MAKQLALVLVFLGFTAGAALPAIGVDRESPRETREKPETSDRPIANPALWLHEKVNCGWQCNDGTQGACDPPPEHCWGECGYACQGHGGVDICAMWELE